MRLLAKERGGRCLSKKYLNGSIELEWCCANGHRWKAIPKVLVNGSWCPTCLTKQSRQVVLQTIGQRVQFIRLEKKLHQEQVAYEAGVAQTVISRLEAGLNVSSTRLVQLANVLNIRTAWLENGKGKPTIKSLNLSADELRLINQFNNLSNERKIQLISWVEKITLEPFAEPDLLLATRLKVRRKELGFTQVHVAEKAGIKQANLSMMEAGKKFSTRSIVAMAAALSVTTEWLVLGYGDPTLKDVNLSETSQQFIRHFRRLNNRKKKEVFKKLG